MTSQLVYWERHGVSCTRGLRHRLGPLFWRMVVLSAFLVSFYRSPVLTTNEICHWKLWRSGGGGTLWVEFSACVTSCDVFTLHQANPKFVATTTLSNITWRFPTYYNIWLAKLFKWGRVTRVTQSNFNLIRDYDRCWLVTTVRSCSFTDPLMKAPFDINLPTILRLLCAYVLNILKFHYPRCSVYKIGVSDLLLVTLLWMKVSCRENLNWSGFDKNSVLVI